MGQLRPAFRFSFFNLSRTASAFSELAWILLSFRRFSVQRKIHIFDLCCLGRCWTMYLMDSAIDQFSRSGYSTAGWVRCQNQFLSFVPIFRSGCHLTRHHPNSFYQQSDCRTDGPRRCLHSSSTWAWSCYSSLLSESAVSSQGSKAFPRLAREFRTRPLQLKRSWSRRQPKCLI